MDGPSARNRPVVASAGAAAYKTLLWSLPACGKETIMDKQELLEQNTAIRAAMADASTLLDRAYGSSGERLELRIARLIKLEARLRTALVEAQQELCARRHLTALGAIKRGLGED